MIDRPRTGPERKADALAQLEARGADAWVATASSAGVAHLVPLSFAWRDGRVVLAAMGDSPTVRNIRESRRARLGFGPTRDVVLIDTELDEAFDLEHVDSMLAQAYAEQSGWDPRRVSEAYVFLTLLPRRIQSWREANELAGRTLMRDGAWLF